MKVLGQNPDGSIKITFDFRLNPRRTHNYSKWYIEQFYEYAGYKSTWELGPGLKDLTVQQLDAQTIVKDAFSAIEDDKVLFGNYTGKDKVNIWKEVE